MKDFTFINHYSNILSLESSINIVINAEGSYREEIQFADGRGNVGNSIVLRQYIYSGKGCAQEY